MNNYGLASPTQNKLKMPGAYDPAPGPIPDASAAAYVPGKTDPAPAPKANALKPAAAPQMSPYAAPKKPLQNALLGSAVDGFMRGFAPQQREADIDRRKAEGVDKMKKTLALIEQQRALPMEQRAQWWEANVDGVSEIMGQDMRAMPVDPNQFSDQALDGHRAMLSAQLGIAPEVAEPMNAYEAELVRLKEAEAGRPTPFNLGDGAFAEYDPNGEAGKRLSMLRDQTEAPIKYEQFTDVTGQVWDVNPYTRERIKADGMRARVPQDNPSSANDTYRPATLEDRARWGLPPEGAFKINERTGEPAAISGARAAQDFSPTEIRGFRDQADGLYILQNAVNQYVAMLEKMGGPQLLDTPFNAENSQALKSAHGLITEAIKDAGKLGALDQGVQNLVNAIIQEPVGWGTFGKSTESIKQAANQLNSSIEFKLSRVPEEYRAGSTGAVPDFESDDDDFIDTLFEPAPNAPAPAPASSRATPMATVNPGTSTGRFHKGNDPRQTQRPTAPRPQPAARPPVQSQQPPPDIDPEDWKYFTPEMKQQYLAGRGQ